MSSSPTDTQTVEIVMPQMGVSVAEGTIVEWSKRPGDWVERDETVCLVTTDKIDVEIPSPAAGRLAKILVEPGDTVDVGTPLAELDAGARPGEAHPEEHQDESERTTEPKATGEPEPAAVEPRPVQGDGEADRSGFHSPVVRRMADEHGIDLSQVEGTGIGGRIRKRDLVALIESGASTAPEETAEPETERPLHIESPYQPERRRLPPPRSGGRGERRVAGRGRTARRAARADDADAAADRRAHAREPAHLGALHDDRRGRSPPGRGHAPRAEGGDGPSRGAAHLPRLRGERCGGRAAIDTRS